MSRKKNTAEVIRTLEPQWPSDTIEFRSRDARYTDGVSGVDIQPFKRGKKRKKRWAQKKSSPNFYRKPRLSARPRSKRVFLGIVLVIAVLAMFVLLSVGFGQIRGLELSRWQRDLMSNMRYRLMELKGEQVLPPKFGFTTTFELPELSYAPLSFLHVKEPRHVVHKVRQGDTVADILQANKVAAEDVQGIVGAVTSYRGAKPIVAGGGDTTGSTNKDAGGLPDGESAKAGASQGKNKKANGAASTRKIARASDSRKTKVSSRDKGRGNKSEVANPEPAEAQNSVDAAKGNKKQDGAQKATSLLQPLGGRNFELQYNIHGRLAQVRYEYELGSSVVLQSQQLIARADNSVNNSGSNWTVRLLTMQRGTREYVAEGRITSSLAQDAMRVGVSYDVIDDFVDLFSDRVAFHQDLHPGDRFLIIFRDEVLEDGTSLNRGKILAAALSIRGETMAAIMYRGADGESRYFNEKGEELGNNFLRYPLKFSRISSYFSDARLHPVLGIKKPHNGVDFAAPTGTPVRSVAHGVVMSAGWSGPSGQLVKIRHSERYYTAYAHLSRIAPGIRPGASVKRGQVIGDVGTTGRSTGPHLHFAFFDMNKYVDYLKVKLPTSDFLDSRLRMSKQYMNRALLTLSHYLRTEQVYADDANVRVSTSDVVGDVVGDVVSDVGQEQLDRDAGVDEKDVAGSTAKKGTKAVNRTVNKTANKTVKKTANKKAIKSGNSSKSTARSINSSTKKSTDKSSKKVSAKSVTKGADKTGSEKTGAGKKSVAKENNNSTRKT